MASFHIFFRCTYFIQRGFFGGGTEMKRRINQHTFQSWIRTFKSVCKQLIIPFTIFQAIRTVLFPTTFDVLLLTIFIATALVYHYELI